jgi:hypothetical protein
MLQESAAACALFRGSDGPHPDPVGVPFRFVPAQLAALGIAAVLRLDLHAYRYSQRAAVADTAINDFTAFPP